MTVGPPLTIEEARTLARKAKNPAEKRRWLARARALEARSRPTTVEVGGFVVESWAIQPAKREHPWRGHTAADVARHAAKRAAGR